jgi:hypothetical protein
MSVGSTLATIGAAEMLAFSTAAQAALLTNFFACLTPDSKFDEIQISDLSSGTVPTLHDRTNTGTVGTEASNSLPAEMAVTLSKRTGLKGQHGFGRVSMPAVPASCLDLTTSSNKLNGTGLGLYGNFADTMELSITHGLITYKPVVTTRPIAPATLTSKAAIITSVILRDQLGTQLRRRPGRGI